MDGLTVKPASRVNRPAAVKSNAQGVRPAAPTELPPTQTVTPASDGAPQESFHAPRDPLSQQFARNPLIEAEVREVIYRAIDESADAASPDAAVKLRAYQKKAATEQDESEIKSVEKNV
jgi:hypothetical protein